MRGHIFYVPTVLALLVGAWLAPALAAPGGIEGSWSGSGIAKYGNRTDRVVCRVSFSRYGAQSFKVSSNCTSGNTQYQQSGTVANSGGSAYSGHVFNPQFNERGKVAISQRGSQLAVTVTSDKGTATLTLSRN
jgi:hypothetical protein